MANKPLIAASILSANFAILAKEIQTAEAAGVDWIHIDVMDGHFVPNLSMGDFVIETVNRVTDLPLDVHLMISNPDSYLEKYAQAGADILTVHAETCPHLHRTLQRIKELGCKAGVALNPATSLHGIEEIARELDLLLIMTVNPGFSGQAYIENSTTKVARARALLEEHGSQALIEVDGGIYDGNIRVVIEAGARVCVAASAIFKHPEGIGAGVKSLQDATRVLS
jgi:ribulose-phosphate 3-epimerase